MNIEINNDPFPHIIIENYFNEDECGLIWKEIEFLFPKLSDPTVFAGAKNPDGSFMTNSYGMTLDNVYRNRDISDILTFSNKIFSNELFLKLIEKNDYWYTIDHSSSDYTKLRYYGEGTKYDPHQDTWVNVLVSTTFCKDELEGGDLYFPNHNYLIKSEHNKTVVFPGWIRHGITEVIKNYRFAITKFIHCGVPD